MATDSIPLELLPLALRARLALEVALTGLNPAEIIAEALAAHLAPQLHPWAARPSAQAKAPRAAS